MGDKSVDLLKLLRKPGSQGAGLYIAVVNTADPTPVTLVIEGTALPLDLDVFEIPVACYPLRKGDRLLVFPLIGTDLGQRWAAVDKINGGLILATMTGASSCQVEGIGREYSAADLIVPPYFAISNTSSIYSDSYTGKNSDNYLKKEAIRPLKAGDRVALSPTLEAGAIKYVIIELVEGV